MSVNALPECARVGIVVAIFSISMNASLAAAQELKSVELAGTAVDFALDTSTGNLAAVEAAENKVVLYGADFATGVGPAKPLATATVGDKPASVVYKEAKGVRLFVVGCLSDSHLYLLDSATLKQVAKVPVASSDVSSLATSATLDDPYVYYCYARGHDSSTGRVDVVKQIDQGKAFDDSMDCAISARGNFAYRRGPWSPSGFESLRIIESAEPGGKAFFPRLFYDHNSTAQYVPDPFEAYTAAGSRIYTVGLEKKVAELTFAPVCFFTDRPIIAGLEGAGGSSYSRSRQTPSQVVLASYNTFAPLDKKPLPSDLFSTGSERVNLAGPGDADFKFVGARTRMFADDARKRLVVAYANHAVDIPLSTFKLQDEPYLVVEAKSNAPLIVGRKNVVPLTTRDSRIKVELVDQWENASLTADGFEWTPDESFVGPQALRLRLSHADLERTVAIELSVEREGVALPFEADRLTVAHDGNTALVWTVPGGNAGFPSNNAGNSVVPRAAIVDLAAGKVLAEAALPFIAEAGAVDQHFAYVVQRGTGTVTVLDRAGLAQKKQIALDGTISWLKAVGGKMLIVGMSDGTWIKYASPELTLVAEHRAATQQNFGFRQTSSIG